MKKQFQQILMWKLISIYFGCAFIACTFCDAEIYLLNYLCKADTEVTGKKKNQPKLDILRGFLSFKAVDDASQNICRVAFDQFCEATLVLSGQTLQGPRWLCSTKASAGHSRASWTPNPWSSWIKMIHTHSRAPLNLL